MKDRLKVLWIVVAIVLVAPTTTLDFQTLFVSDGARARAGDVPLDFAPHRNRAPNSPLRQGSTPPLRYDLCPGDSTTFPYAVHIPPAPLQADILLAFDTTFSMANVIEATQESADEITSSLQDLIDDVRFGIVDFQDYPFDPYGMWLDVPYHLHLQLNHRQADVRTKIQELEVMVLSGGDTPEAYSRVLYEAYADEQIDWRPEARRLIIMFGDSVPHDDDLNAGIPAPQPHFPGEVWQTGSYPPPHLDPGRDAEEGTADDLDFQSVLSSLRDRSITLLFVVSDVSRNLGVTTDQLLVYWKTWAAMTGPGGDARMLEDAEMLPETIEELLTAAVRHLNQLTLHVAPSWFEEWVTLTPPAYDDLSIPANGLDLDFQVAVAVPPTVPAGHYIFDLIAEGDGTVYQRQRVEITVRDTCFATPTPTWAPPPTPRPRRMLYIPFVTNNQANWQP